MQILVTESKSFDIPARHLFEEIERTNMDYMFEDVHPNGKVFCMFLALQGDDALSEHMDRFCNTNMFAEHIGDLGYTSECQGYEVYLFAN